MAGEKDGAMLVTQGTPPGEQAEDDEILRTVRGLEEQLAQRRRGRWLRGLAMVLSLGAAAAGFWIYRRATALPPEERFSTSAVARRDVLEEVHSTGVVEPIHRVEVGAQVSGRVVRVLADFNDQVKEGQLLAEIDPELFGADVVQTSAQLESSRAALGRAKAAKEAAHIRLSRLKLLVAEAAASEAELDQAQADFDMASAEVGAAEAQQSQVEARLKSARTTLKYTKIYSPIDGVVIDRLVEPGQTVASSFNTPVLFEIARDLTKMRVIAEVDEADVGKIREGMSAEIVVDAFPSEEFSGTLTQLRLSPNNVEGVVTYGAVIAVDNPAGKLRPGLTATVRVVTARAENVVAVRNAALRFEPLRRGEGSGDSPEKAESPRRPEPGEGRIYRIVAGPPDDPEIETATLELGISDGVWTEVKGGLSEGAEVIVDEKADPGRRGFRLF